MLSTSLRRRRTDDRPEDRPGDRGAVHSSCSRSVSALMLPKRNPNFPGRAPGLVPAAQRPLRDRDALRRADLRQGEGAAEAATRRRRRCGADGRPARVLLRRPRAPAIRPPGKPSSRVPAAASCHTLKDAGSTGTVGPNLDQLKPPFERVKIRSKTGRADALLQGDADAERRSTNVSAYVSSVAGK